jgi:hypothetical protein
MAEVSDARRVGLIRRWAIGEYLDRHVGVAVAAEPQ